MNAAIALSNFKDVLGLIGTVLIAWPFFRQESTKRLADRLNEPPTRNKTLLDVFARTREHALSEINQPNWIDLWLVRIGLVLVGVSFVISIALPYMGSG